MINLTLAQNSILSSQDKYDIISFAMEVADDNGFINSFVYERALYCYTAIMLYPERREEIAALVTKSPLEAWDSLIADGTINTMYEEYKDIIETVSNEAAIWYEEYSSWAHSARGILDMVQDFTGDIVQSAARKLKDTAKETGVSEILEVAEDWGMTRSIGQPEIAVKYESPKNSLFTD